MKREVLSITNEIKPSLLPELLLNQLHLNHILKNDTILLNLYESFTLQRQSQTYIITSSSGHAFKIEHVYSDHECQTKVTMNSFI